MNPNKIDQAANEAREKRGPMIHHLKTDPDVFQAVFSGEKTHEIRFDDRDFQNGDILHLLGTKHTGEEMKAGANLEYTGMECYVIVTHILRGPAYGLAPEWVIMSIRKPSFVDTAENINSYLAEYECLNCPCCGGSGHADDCDNQVQKLKAELAALKAAAKTVEAQKLNVELATLTAAAGPVVEWWLQVKSELDKFDVGPNEIMLRTLSSVKNVTAAQLDELSRLVEEKS